MKYVTFHEAEIPKESRVTLHDAVVEDALSFFKYRTYNQNIVDVLVHVTADALNLCLYIYQNYDNNIQIVWVDGDGCVRTIHLKFHKNPVNSEGNHYDAIFLPFQHCEEIKEETQNYNPRTNNN